MLVLGKLLCIKQSILSLKTHLIDIKDYLNDRKDSNKEIDYNILRNINEIVSNLPIVPSEEQTEQYISVIYCTNKIDARRN